jgi:hypothetical protein
MKNLNLTVTFLIVSFTIFSQSKKEQINELLLINDSLKQEINSVRLQSEKEILYLKNQIIKIEEKIINIESIQSLNIQKYDDFINFFDSLQTMYIKQSNEINYLIKKDESFRTIIQLINDLETKWIEAVEPVFQQEGEGSQTDVAGETIEDFNEHYSQTLKYIEQKSKNSIPSFCPNSLKTLSIHEIEPSKIKWDAFTEIEKFCYCMLYPENYSQSCSFNSIFPGQENIITSTFPNFSSGSTDFGDGSYQWSPRQISFLISNREKVLNWVMSESKKDNRIGQNYKSTLYLLNSHESIPQIIETAKKDIKDNDYWSLLLSLCSESSSLEGIIIKKYISDDKLITKNEHNINKIIEISKLVYEKYNH